MRRYVKAGRLGTEARPGIEIACFKLVENVWSNRVVDAQRNNVTLAEIAGGFGLEESTGQRSLINILVSALSHVGGEA